MDKLITNLVSATVNILLYFILISCLLAVSYSFYQTALNINSWSDILNLAADLKTFLPQLNSFKDCIFSVHGDYLLLYL